MLIMLVVIMTFFPSWGHHHSHWFDNVKVMSPCVYRKSYDKLFTVIHRAHRMWNDWSCLGTLYINTDFCAVREGTTSPVAFQVTPLTQRVQPARLWKMGGQSLMDKVLLLRPKYFLPSRHRPIYVALFPISHTYIHPYWKVFWLEQHKITLLWPNTTFFNG